MFEERYQIDTFANNYEYHYRITDKKTLFVGSGPTPAAAWRDLFENLAERCMSGNESHLEKMQANPACAKSDWHGSEHNRVVLCDTPPNCCKPLERNGIYPFYVVAESGTNNWDVFKKCSDGIDRWAGKFPTGMDAQEYAEFRSGQLNCSTQFENWLDGQINKLNTLLNDTPFPTDVNAPTEELSRLDVLKDVRAMCTKLKDVGQQGESEVTEKRPQRMKPNPASSIGYHSVEHDKVQFCNGDYPCKPVVETIVLEESDLQDIESGGWTNESTIHQLIATVRDRDQKLESLQKQVKDLDEVSEEISALRRERDHWKANHDDMILQNSYLRERPDLPVDRIPSYEKQQNVISRLTAALNYIGTRCKCVVESAQEYARCNVENHKTIDCEYTADRWCNGCIAHWALNLEGPPRFEKDVRPQDVEEPTLESVLMEYFAAPASQRRCC